MTTLLRYKGKEHAMVRIVYEKDKRKAFAKAIEGLYIEKDSTVAIKPNLSIQKPGACTNFELLQHLVEYSTEFSPQKIMIVESDTYLRSIWELYEAFSYNSLDIELINLSEEPCTTLWPETTLFFKAFSYPEIFKAIDYVISFAELKTHILTTYTGVLKNQYGLLPFPDKRVFHRHLDKIIIDMNLIFSCDFYILDAVTAMHKEGPLDGDLIELDLLFSGKDPVAVDHCACTTVGIHPETVSHLVLAEKKGIGEFKYSIEGEIPEIKGFTLPQKL
jgi:uncharacterized protein (DUF362 family)